MYTRSVRKITQFLVPRARAAGRGGRVGAIK
jgi:hypothetical protein